MEQSPEIRLGGAGVDAANLSNVMAKKSEPITFGSVITLSLEDTRTIFLTTEGFNKSFIKVNQFGEDSRLTQSDFYNTLFKVMPFSSASNFRYQDKLFNLSKNDEKNTLPQGSPPLCQPLGLTTASLELKQRRMEINELKQNLDVEISINWNQYNKYKGTPVNYETSSFQLLHLKTLKYLSLQTAVTEDQDRENLAYDEASIPRKS